MMMIMLMMKAVVMVSGWLSYEEDLPDVMDSLPWPAATQEDLHCWLCSIKADCCRHQS